MSRKTITSWMYFMVIMLMMTGVVFAVQEAAAPEAPAAADPAAPAEGSGEDAPAKSTLLGGLLTGIVGGIGAAFFGWLKNRDTKTGEMEKFEIKYAWPTLIIGVGIGIASYFFGETPENILGALEASPIYAGITFITEAGLKGVWRNTLPMLRDMLSGLKTAK